MSQKRDALRNAKRQSRTQMTYPIEEGCPLPPGEHWDKADLLFLESAVAQGMPFSEVAGFLCRTEEEVRERSKSLHARHA
jgi:hypothetical protein